MRGKNVEKITVTAKSDLVTSKSKRIYFTIKDERQRKLLCFKPTQHPDFLIGTEVEVEVTPGKSADDTPRVELVTSEQPTETPYESAPQDKPAPQQIGMWWKELGEMLRAGDINKLAPEYKLLRAAYYSKMFEVLNISIPKGKEEKEMANPDYIDKTGRPIGTHA